MGSALGYLSSGSWFAEPPQPFEEEAVDAFEDADMLLDSFLDSLVETTEPPATEPTRADPPATTPPATEPPATEPMEPVPSLKQGRVYKSIIDKECLCCGKRFTRSEHLKNHIRSVHYKIKESRCSVCPKTFSTSSQLGVHMRVHNDERPFACLHPGCNKKFRQKMHMKRHYRVHTGEQPFTCNVCKRAFSQASSMKRHMRKRHAGATISLLGA